MKLDKTVKTMVTTIKVSARPSGWIGSYTVVVRSLAMVAVPAVNLRSSFHTLRLPDVHYNVREEKGKTANVTEYYLYIKLHQRGVYSLGATKHPFRNISAWAGEAILKARAGIIYTRRGYRRQVRRTFAIMNHASHGGGGSGHKNYRRDGPLPFSSQNYV